MKWGSAALRFTISASNDSYSNKKRTIDHDARKTKGCPGLPTTEKEKEKKRRNEHHTGCNTNLESRADSLLLVAGQ